MIDKKLARRNRQSTYWNLVDTVRFHAQHFSTLLFPYSFRVKWPRVDSFFVPRFFSGHALDDATLVIRLTRQPVGMDLTSLARLNYLFSFYSCGDRRHTWGDLLESEGGDRRRERANCVGAASRTAVSLPPPPSCHNSLGRTAHLTPRCSCTL